MTRFRTFALTALIAGSIAAGAAYAQGPGPGRQGPDGFGRPGRGGGPGGPGAGLPLRELNLTEAQQQQVRDVTDRYRDQNRNAAEQLNAAMDARRRAVEAIPFDEGLIRSTTQNLVEAQTEMAVQQARMQSEIFAMLTPAQQDQVRKMKADREARAQQQRQRIDQRRKQGQQ